MLIHVILIIQFIESAFKLRSAGEHSRQCDILEQEDLSSLDHQHFSMMLIGGLC